MIALFAVCALLSLYILIGWPLLLGILATVLKRPYRREFHPRTVTVVMCVYNGAGHLREKLASIFAQTYPQDLIDVIVVSDGSTDDTDAIASSYDRVRLVRVPHGGKSAALSAGIPLAKGEILFLTDVRQALEPNCLHELVSCFADPKVGTASGQLMIRKNESNRGSQDVGLYWQLERWVRHRMSDLDSMFGATGSVYAMRRELAVPIPAEILLDDMYLPLAAFFKGYRLVWCETAIAWDYPTTRHTEFSRKVRTLAGNYQLLMHYPRLLIPFVNRLWFHYLSYKLGRVIMPWTLLGSFVSSFWLPSPWNWVIPAGGVSAVVIALVEEVVPQGTLLKRLMSPVRTFLVMMAAALVALRVFFVDPRTLWRVNAQPAAPDRSTSAGC